MTGDELNAIKARWVDGTWTLATSDVKRLVAEIERLRATLTALAKHGTHHDLNPTRHNDADERFWLAYIGRMDEFVCAAARDALDGAP